tara:strand:+ start:132 stop:410 length:279 start_codon:yes stop_codon:yes gene_type:complete
MSKFETISTENVVVRCVLKAGFVPEEGELRDGKYGPYSKTCIPSWAIESFIIDDGERLTRNQWKNDKGETRIDFCRFNNKEVEAAETAEEIV